MTIETMAEAPALEQGWTGQKCPACNGHGADNDNIRCGDCAGTGDEYGPLEPRESSTAVLSPCGLYRYRLTREWDRSRAKALFVMLNPSTADAEQDDPTIRRCCGFARAWKLGGIEVVNLFAYRATDPRELVAAAKAGTDVEGPESDSYILRAATAEIRERPIIAAWGAHPLALRLDRATRVLELLRATGRTVYTLGTTQGGAPKHPLYLRADLQPEVYLRSG